MSNIKRRDFLKISAGLAAGAAVRLKPQLTYLFDPSSGARLA